MSEPQSLMIPAAPPQVPVKIDEEIASDGEVIESLRRQGLVKLNLHSIRDLKSIGKYVHGAGAISIQVGRCMVTQQRLEEAMRIVYHHLNRQGKKKKPSIGNIQKLGQTLGYLARSQCDFQHLMLTLEGGSQATVIPVGGDGQVPAFAAGANVQPRNLSQTVIHASEVHMHGADAPATTK